MLSSRYAVVAALVAASSSALAIAPGAPALQAEGAPGSFAHVAFEGKPATTTAPAATSFKAQLAPVDGKLAHGLSAPVSPVAEPSTYALMFAGLGAIGFVARRRAQQAKRAP